jgi:hypothetical protein
MDWGELREMTIDMTQNRVPYGLLTDEEKAALHEHEKAGGKVLAHHHSQEWVGVNFMADTYPDFVYRTDPLPKTQDVIAWDRLPEWVEWVVKNEDGRVHATQKEPHYTDDYWFYFDVDGCVLRIDDFPGIVQIGTCDWRDSKQRRPR